MENSLKKTVIERYLDRFSGDYLLARSPGRVNIIGEHTDYNDGFVLPAAINKAAYVCAGKSDNKVIQLHAASFNENYQSSVEYLLPSEAGWPNYILGVVDQLQKRGYHLSGFNLVIDADVPPGSGMSSSAALECATVIVLNELFDLNVPEKEMTEIAQKAEHTFVGVQCGIMDQFASVFSKKNHVIKLDCRSLDYEYIPLNLDKYKIVLLNTNVSHSLASSEYNTRRKQCEEGVRIMQQNEPEIKSLRDADHMMVDKYLSSDPLLHKRCSYVVEENERLLEACDHLRDGDIWALGKLMFKSHAGLSHKYEVSCPELDFLVNEVKENPNVLGARMMGGGFGGCTINLVHEDTVEELIEKTSASYLLSMEKELTAFIAETSDGGMIIRDQQRI